MNSLSNEVICQKVKVLIVDDEINILRSLRRLLRHTGYQLVFTNSGKEAINIINTQEIGVVLCDQNMTDLLSVNFA